jgi:hypothetical protein
LQSKYVKFLQFLKDEKFSDFKKYDRVICTDHKLRIKDRHIKRMLEIQSKPILIRDHPKKRKNIWEEIGQSMFQERYLSVIQETIDYVREKIKSGCDAGCGRHKICTTGLVSYEVGNGKVHEFLDELYRDIIKLGTSQCQIVWFMVAQKYADIIQVIGWDDLDISWRDPAMVKWTIFPILKIRYKENKTIWRLFGIIPVFQGRPKNHA